MTLVEALPLGELVVERLAVRDDDRGRLSEARLVCTGSEASIGPIRSQSARLWLDQIGRLLSGQRRVPQWVRGAVERRVVHTNQLGNPGLLLDDPLVISARVD